MKFVQRLAIVIAFASAAALVIHDVVAIGEVYAEKSLYSYLLKSGDLDSGSAAASAHVGGVQEYGLLVGLRLVIVALLSGFILGAALGRRRSWGVD